MMSCLGRDNRLSGEETKPFIHKLRSMLDQMEASQIPADCGVSALFSVLTEKAREAVSNIRTPTVSLEQLVGELFYVLLHEPNIQAHKLFCWNSVTFSELRKKPSAGSSVARDSITYVTPHRKDLPKFSVRPKTLLMRLKDIFKGQT